MWLPTPEQITQNYNATNMNINWEAAGKAAAAAAQTYGPTLINNALQNRNAYPQCGTRPLFPGRRRQAYEQCVANAVQLQNQRIASTTSQDWLKNATPFLLIGGLAAGLYYFNKRK